MAFLVIKVHSKKNYFFLINKVILYILHLAVNNILFSPHRYSSYVLLCYAILIDDERYFLRYLLFFSKHLVNTAITFLCH